MALILYGCSPSYDDSYIVLGKITPQSTPSPFNFAKTLSILYPDCNEIFIGKVNSVDINGVSFEVIESIIGSFSQNKQYKASPASGPVPLTGGYYLFFASSDNGAIRLLTDASGYLRVNGDIVSPQTGEISKLDNIRKDIDKVKNNIVLPSNFLYYKDIDQLVNATDYIFKGQIIDIGAEYEESFFSRTGGVEEAYVNSATPITIKLVQAIKGKVAPELKFLLSQNMLDSTIVNSTLKHTGYSKSDMAPLEINGNYLFFAINTPGGANSNHLFFTNPFQGFVPVYGNELMAIPTNAAFAYPRIVDDAVLEIQSIMAGDSFVTFPYEG